MNLSRRPLSHRLILAGSVASALFAPSNLRAVDGLWLGGPDATLWNNTTYWQGGVVADGIDANAYFVFDPLADASTVRGANIPLDTGRTVGNIYMTDVDGIGSSSLAIGSANTLTLATTTGTPTVEVGLLLNNQFVNNKKAIFNNPLGGTQGFTKTGLGFLSLRSTADTVSGTVTVAGGTLDSRVAVNNNVVVTGAGTLNLDLSAGAITSNIVGAGQTLTLGGAGGSGFVINVAKQNVATSQTFASTTINAGGNVITAVSNNSAAGQPGAMAYTLGTITRNAGGALNFAVTTANGSTTTFNTTSTNDAAGILGGWATYNGSDFARVNAGVISATSVPYTANTWGANINTNVTGVNFSALPNFNTQTNATTHSLRFNDSVPRILTLAGTNTIETGGILFAANTNSMHQINGGALRPSPGVSDLTVSSFATGNGWGPIINSDIIDNGAAVQLVKAGSGNLVIDGDKSYTGGTIVGQGTLILGKALGGSATGNITGPIVNSGVLAFNRSGTLTPTNAITGNGVVAQWSEGALVLGSTVSAGGLDLRNGATTLDFSAAGAPANNIVPAGTQTANALWTGGGRLTLRNATLNVKSAASGTNIQHFAVTDIQGSTSINLIPQGAGSVRLELGAYNRPNNSNDGAGVLKVSLSAGATLAVPTSFPGGANSLVADNGQAFVTVNGTDWGAKDATNSQIVAGSTLGGFYTNLSSLAGNADYDVDTNVAGATTLTSLRFNTVAAPGTLTVASGQQLKLGGILVTPNAASTTTIAGPGSISAINTAGRDLNIFQNGGQSLTISAPIVNATTTAADTTNIVKNGAGELILTAANTFTGKTYVDGGLLRLTSGNIGTASVTSSNVFVRDGEMRLEGTSSVNTGTNFVSIGQRLGETGILSLRGNSTWTTNADFNVSDVLGTGTVSVQDSAALTVFNLFLGKNGSSVGTLNISGGTALVSGGASDVRIGGNNPGDSIAQGIINQSAGTFTVNRNFQMGAWGVGTYNQTGGNYVATAGFTGIGRFVSGQGTWNISGGSMDITAAGAGAFLIVGEQGSGTLNVSGTGSVLTKNISIGHNVGLGVVTQTGGTVSANATGTVTNGSVLLAGVNLAPTLNSVGTYNLSGGTLTTQAVSKGLGTATFNFNGGTLKPVANAAAFVNSITNLNVQAGGAKIDTNSFNVSISQALRHDPALGTTDGGLTKNGNGVLTLSTVASTYTGATVVNGGTLKLEGAPLTLPAGVTPALRFDASNTASVTVDGSNNVSAWADQGTQVNNAVLPSGVFPPVYNPTGLNGKGTITFAGGANATSSRLETLANTNLTGASARTLFTVMARGTGNIFAHTGEQGTNNLAFGTSLETANTFFYLWGNDVTTGTVQPSNQFVMTSQRYDGANLSGSLNGNLIGNLATAAANTSNSPLELGSRRNVANTAWTTANGSIAEVLLFSSALSVSDRLQVEAYLNYKWFNTGTLTNVLPTSTPVTVGASGTLDLNGVNQIVGSLSGAAGSTVTLGSATLTTGGDNTSTTFAGVISGSGGLAKLGNGVLTLDPASNLTYAGPTAVSAGTLLVKGVINGTASLSVGSSGILAGAGSITTIAGGGVAVSAGGQIAPGNAAAGTLTMSLGAGQLDLSAPAGGTGYLSFELGTASDRVLLSTGTLNIGSGGLDLDDFAFSNSGGFGPGSYVLFDSATDILGTLGSHLTGTVLGFNATLAFANGTNGHDDLVLTVVPEPGSAVMLLGGLALLGVRRRRSR